MYGIAQSIYHRMRFFRNQWLSPPEIEAIQRRKLKTIVKHAYENVDYYRQLFDSAGIKPEEIKEREDLLRIPTTTKKQLQSQPIEKITAKDLNLRECTKLNTSGSTGIPLDIILSKEDLRFRGAVLSRAFLAHGGRLRDKVVQITHSPSSHQKHWYENLGIRRWYGISPFSEIDDQIDQLKRMNSDILIGFPSGLLAIAKAVKEKGVEGISPRITLSGAEILTSPTREFLNATFRTTTIDSYNSVEFGSIAWECKYQAGYHINTDVLIVEVIRDGRRALPGDRGEIVITALNAYAMPLIRYHLGDTGVLTDRRCRCGRGLPLLERIEGRANDDIKLPDGKRISPAVITTALEVIPGISQFRLVQEDKDEFRVYLAKGGNYCPTILDQVERELKKILGDPIGLHIQVVDEIPLDPSGKLRAVVSKVGS
jgi:phenylacetate-CoA ligase